MTPQELARKAAERLNLSITDEIFLIIQNDRELMQEYLQLVHQQKAGEVNREIGKEVKKIYNLSYSAKHAREKQPKSTLIKSHQIFDAPN